MKSIVTVIVFLLIGNLITNAYPTPFAKEPNYIQLSIYHFKDKQQEALLDSFLQWQYIPAARTLTAAPIGVFKPLANDTAINKQIIVLLSFGSLKQWEKYLRESVNFIDNRYTNILYNKPSFDRVETILMKAFEEMPVIKAPQLSSLKSERIYELRSYESGTEASFRNKVKMFNEGGEVKLFDRLGFNAVFYGEVIAGSKMPNLMYMTSFDNKNSRDEHWKAFGNDPEWKKLSSMKEYQNNVSHIDITFLKPTDYSEL